VLANVVRGSGEPVLEPSDSDLWRSAAAGDHAAFHVLVDRYGPGLFRVARSLSANRPDAEDLCQETFAAAYCGLKQFDGRASFRTWLTSILVRRAAKAWKKSRHARQNVSLHSNDRPDDEARASSGRPAGGRPSAAPATLDVDRRLDVLEVIRSLAPEFRDAIVLREIEGLSYQEIADVLGVPRGTVESRLHRGRAELRRKLTGY
jgi:RNA polymerase sigma-70 factor (ECF subfamily)